MTTKQKIEIAAVLCPALYAIAASPDTPVESRQPALDKANALYNFLISTANEILA